MQGCGRCPPRSSKCCGRLLVECKRPQLNRGGAEATIEENKKATSVHRPQRQRPPALRGGCRGTGWPWALQREQTMGLPRPIMQTLAPRRAFTMGMWADGGQMKGRTGTCSNTGYKARMAAGSHKSGKTHPLEGMAEGEGARLSPKTMWPSWQSLAQRPRRGASQLRAGGNCWFRR